MFRSFVSPFLFSTFCIILFIILLFGSFVPLIASNYNIQVETSMEESFLVQLNSSNFIWPTPGYSTITSYYGYRKAPTGGASTYHSGIDIAAPTGCNIVGIFSGTVTFTGFSGAGGYTITIKNGDFTASYCHVSPNFKVFVGQSVKKGQVIGNVGPKNVYGVSSNPYKDKSGNPTNGATTGPHLHLTIKKNGKSVNPLDYF